MKVLLIIFLIFCVRIGANTIKQEKDANSTTSVELENTTNLTKSTESIILIETPTKNVTKTKELAEALEPTNTNNSIESKESTKTVEPRSSKNTTELTGSAKSDESENTKNSTKTEETVKNSKPTNATNFTGTKESDKTLNIIEENKRLRLENEELKREIYVIKDDNKDYKQHINWLLGDV